jgi:hypothetical protein
MSGSAIARLRSEVRSSDCRRRAAIAEGEYVAFVPSEALKPYLTPEDVKIFGGAQSKGDEDDQR